MAIKQYKNVGRVLFEFTLRKNIKQAVLIGILCSITISSSALGFAKAYPTEMSRKLVAATFESNAGLIALLGKPENLATIAGFTAWRSLGALTLIVGIWALFLSTRLFRGDEEQGRLELLLTGKSSLVNATKQLFLAMCTIFVAPFAIITIAASVLNGSQSYDWRLQSVAFLAFVLITTALLFASIGMLASQITATRAAALKAAAAIFGISFMLRALGDISSNASWLTSISPLGWLGHLHPLSNTNAIWLMPIFATISLCVCLSLFIASKRDYGASIVPDKDTTEPKYKLLNSGAGLLLRLHKNGAWLWALSLGVANFMFGTFLSSASTALSESNGLQGSFNKVAKSSTVNFAELFAGVIFTIMMLLLLIMVAGQINSFREEESRGYLDNLLVRQASRIGLSITKTGLIVVSVAISAGAIAAGMYFGARSQHVQLDAWNMVGAGINLLAMPLLFLGIGFLLFGFLPRLMSAILYTIISWTFVIEIVGSVANLNHWLLDTSLLHHLALAPAADVRWSVFWAYIILGIILALLGIWRFTKRDIELM